MVTQLFFVLIALSMHFPIQADVEGNDKDDEIFLNPKYNDSEIDPSAEVELTFFDDYNEALGNGSTVPSYLSLLDIENRISRYLTSSWFRMLPEALKASSQMELSSKCLFSLGFVAYQAAKLQEWSFRILDATGKITDGILEGTSIALGDYDECQNAVVGGKEPTWEDDTAQYCLLEIRPPRGVVDAVREYQTSENKSFTPLARTTTFFRFLKNVKTNPEDIAFLLGVCIPPKCTAQEIQNAIDYATENIRLPVRVRRCEAKRFPTLEIQHIVILCILGVAAGMVLIGTLFDAFLRVCQDNKDKEIELSKLSRFFMNFSLFFNTSKLMDAELDGNALDPVRGLKVMSVIMIIFAHTYALPDPLHGVRYRSIFNFLKFTNNVSFAVIANSSVAVDTVFFVVGFLSVYYYWNQDFRRSIMKYIFKFFFIQYLRFILAQVLTMCLFSLLPLIGSGPLWHEFVEEKIHICTQKWWINLLCIQNFWRPKDTCLFHSWILAVAMQIYVFTAAVLWVFYRKPSVAMMMNFVIILASLTSVAVLTSIKGLPATVSVYFIDDYRLMQEVWNYVYVQSYAHMGPYCIGMMVAYTLVKYPSVKLAKPGVLFFWCAAITTCLSIIYGLYDYRESKPMARCLAVFYAAVHRTAWALAVGWMTYACATGYGGFINAVLSWKLYVPLERLSYMAYMIHIPLMYFHGGMQRERIFMGHFTQAMNFLSYTVISFIISYFTFILFQGPYNALECFICVADTRNVWKSKMDDNQMPVRRISYPENGVGNFQETPVQLFSRSTETIQTNL